MLTKYSHVQFYLLVIIITFETIVYLIKKNKPFVMIGE